MLMRRKFLLLGLGLSVCGLVCLYLILQVGRPDVTMERWVYFEDRIRQIERDLSKHHESVSQIKQVMKEASSPRPLKPTSRKEAPKRPPGSLPTEIMYAATCPFQSNYVPRADIQMLDLYKSLKFDNPDGGAWKQGFRITYREGDWNSRNKLKVYLVPHSHNDPGWLRTVEEYFAYSTKHILDNMVDKLIQYPKMRFIWAEISYFVMWWSELNNAKQSMVKSLLDHGQLEIVSGGWVMPDEANTHWTSVLLQFVEGHQWLRKNLNYTVKSSWSIDPFGHSPTLPYLLKRMGLENLLIQRTHYSVKKELAHRQHLEFRWKQFWDGGSSTELFTHMMPFYSYDVPHTCGPDPKVCCQFDFHRLPGRGIVCPWNIPPKKIDDTNVGKRAFTLLDQYRKKAKLYKTNHLLVPLGDDFRYDKFHEWDDQYTNYQMLFDHMNSVSSMNVEAKFSTLSEYFDALRADSKLESFPTLVGDFFTYADRNDNYWSGYFTSRPFYKRVERLLLSHIRAAEILSTLCLESGKAESSLFANPEILYLLGTARQALSLFQHHDGITGTAKDYVVVDYAKKMLVALDSSRQLIERGVTFLLADPDYDKVEGEKIYFNMDDFMDDFNMLPLSLTVPLSLEIPIKTVVLFNSLTFDRREVVTFQVTSSNVQVTDSQSNAVLAQISPIFGHSHEISEYLFKLSFVAEVPALSVVRYTITMFDVSETPPETAVADVVLMNVFENQSPPHPFKSRLKRGKASAEFTVSNRVLSASFNGNGLLKAVAIDGKVMPVHLDFATYAVRTGPETSGAYLFLPEGDAITVETGTPPIQIIEGPIFSSVTVVMPFMNHTVVLYKSPGPDSLGVEIINHLNIARSPDQELAMRISTNIMSGDEFFTDLNAYQFIRRKRLAKLPLQANYYPMATAAFVEDGEHRLTVVSSAPLGCSSPKQGQLEIMQDRRSSHDDNRGLGQGVLDNLLTRLTFRLVIETKTPDCKNNRDSSRLTGYHTVSSHVVSLSLLNSPIKLLQKKDQLQDLGLGSFSTSTAIGVDITLPALREGLFLNGTQLNVGIILHRQYLEVCYASADLLKKFPLSDGTVKISDILNRSAKQLVHKASLSFLHLKEIIRTDEPYSICPMETEAFVMYR